LKTFTKSRIWALLRILIFIFGLAIILYAASLIHNLPGGKQIEDAAYYCGEILSYGFPHFLQLVLTTAIYIWPPILAYIIVGIIAESRLVQFFYCVVLLSILIIAFKSKITLSFSDLDAFLFSIQGLIMFYLILLWTFPRELWNFFGLAVSGFYSIIVYLLPDLPSMLDDLGFMAAFFSYVFLVLHTIASIIQRFIDSRVTGFIRKKLFAFFASPSGNDVTIELTSLNAQNETSLTNEESKNVN